MARFKRYADSSAAVISNSSCWINSASFSLQYHDQTDFVLSGEQPVLAPEEVFQIDMIITRNVIIRIFEEPAVTHKVTCSISQISRHWRYPVIQLSHRHLRQPVINRGIEMLKLII